MLKNNKERELYINSLNSVRDNREKTKDNNPLRIKALLPNSEYNSSQSKRRLEIKPVKLSLGKYKRAIIIISKRNKLDLEKTRMIIPFSESIHTKIARVYPLIIKTRRESKTKYN